GKLVHSAKQSSVSTGAYSIGLGDESVIIIYEGTDFYHSKRSLYDNGQTTAINIPDDADIEGLFKGRLYVQLKTDWQNFPQGALIAADINGLKAGQAKFELFQAPGQGRFIKGVAFSQNSVLISWLDNVRSSIVRYSQTADGQWAEHKLALDDKAVLSISEVDLRYPEFQVSYSSFVEPASLYKFSDQKAAKLKLKAMPALFAAERFKVEQHWVNSKDGTRVPYYVVMDKDTVLNGNNPTLLYGYGGFEISLLPRYSAVLGKNWLERGGVYVLSNIRGGGEFGPAWHQSALKQNRHKAYQDFEAIAEDLIAKKITSPRHLGIQGGSNGGLLMGNAFTRRPDLYNAVVCQVPLLDMKRYNKLLAGASWMAEYGNPDIAQEWEFIKTFSPYHMVSKDKKYPKVFFTTSTRDDRVHPGHARKMVALMQSQGHDVLYYENIEGGHAGAADNRQRAELLAMVYAYLWERLQ
ncbi:MAG: prolyl oligopeptidase family serine peptidase, partial [Cellvibrionaceae bacterium]|nr:prolyl oligopeptidase family serine peptidase [Cellvibrionaceae bacterium]